MIAGISGFGFLSKNGCFVTHNCFFKNWCAEAPIFIVFFGCALFLPSCQKKGNFGHPPQKGKNGLVTEKLIFWYFSVFWVFVFFFCFCYFCFCFFGLLVFCCFFWRVYGSGEVAQRATSLGPKPSLFVFVCLFCFYFYLFFFPFFASE